MSINERLALTTSENKTIPLTSKIKFLLSNNTLIMRMPWQELSSNMQDDGAAFEGCAAAIKSWYSDPDWNGTVCLDLQNGVTLPTDPMRVPNPDGPHYRRFLYRALRFSQQYDWFTLSDPLRGATNQFSDFLQKNRFTNNVPLGEADPEKNGKLEHDVEIDFADNDRQLLAKLLGVQQPLQIYRQLPVGLFLEEKKAENSIFTGKHSAIDLWTIHDDTLLLFELKAKNAMVGAISELFFYTNYLYDFYVDHSNSFHPQSGRNYRGYGELPSKQSELKQVKGYILSDRRHPLLEGEKVINVLNTSNQKRSISYGALDYDIDKVLQNGQP